MAVVKYTQEIKLGVPAKRMFKALTKESYNLLPKIIPEIKSIDILQGDGGAGTIRQMNFPDGAPFPYVKHRIDEIDSENYVVKFALIEGAVLGEKIVSSNYIQKFEDSSDGGCILKVVSEYHTKDGVLLREEEIKAGKERGPKFYPLVEEYLLAHPDVCA